MVGGGVGALPLNDRMNLFCSILLILLFLRNDRVLGLNIDSLC